MLRIRNWDRHYETNKTRPLKTLSWIALPVALDSDGYAELMEHENGAAHFGIFVALLEVGARCLPRGCLSRARNAPHDARSLSRVCRIPAPMVQEALDRLLSIGWIETWHQAGTMRADDQHETGDTLPVGITGITGTTQPTVPVLEGGPVGHNQPGRPTGNGDGEATSDPLTGGPTSPERRAATEKLREQVKAQIKASTAPMEKTEP